MLKFVGLIGIVLSLGLVGIMKYEQLKTRVNLLEDFLQMILELKGQIGYFKEPLPLIFARAEKKGDSKAFKLLGSVESKLNQKDDEIAKIWPLAVSEIYNDMPLQKEDFDTIKYLGTFIGQTDYDNHIFHFSYLEEKLANQIADGKNSLKTKGPMYRKIGFFLGAILAILVI